MDCTSRSIYVSAALFVHTHTVHGRWQEWLAIGTDLYFPSLFSILWDQLCHRSTSGGLLQCVTAGVGCVCIVDSLSSWIRIYTVTHSFFPELTWCMDNHVSVGLVLHNAPWVSDRILPISARLGVHSNRFCKIDRCRRGKGLGGWVKGLEVLIC